MSAAIRTCLVRGAMLLAATAIAVASPRGAAAQQPIVVIVNRGNPLDNISADDLQRLYLGSTTLFANKERVVLYEQSDLRDPFYRAVLHMNGDHVKRHWIGVVFAGLGATPPKTVPGPAQLLGLVGNQKGAIGFLIARQADTTVKVLAVDGLRPGDPGYPLITDEASDVQ